MNIGWFLLLAAIAYPQTIKVDVPLVSVTCSVTDRNGAPVRDLKREDFALLDNGQPRDIRYFWQESDLPLTIGLIADVSGSQLGCIKHHRDTLKQFLAQVIGPSDRAFIVTVGPEVKLLTDLTSSVADLRQGVDRLVLRQHDGVQLGEPCRGPGAPKNRRRRVRIGGGCGGTALWNGVYSAARLKMKPLTGRKALIVLTDGMDTGSFHSLTDAIEAAQSADTVVYTIRCISPVMYASLAALALPAGGHWLNRLAEETGGRAYSKEHDPAKIFATIEAELRNLYVLGFTPPEEARTGQFRKLQVTLAKSGATVRTRKGYAVAPP